MNRSPDTRARPNFVVMAILLVAFACGTASAQATRAEAKHSNAPANGFVPDSTAAIKIAEAVLVPIYSERVIANERPFHAKLVGDVWTVEGTLSCGSQSECLGGVAVVESSRKDGRILRVSHGR